MSDVNITLTKTEAEVLSWLLASVAGDINYSGRRYTDSISEKLWDLNAGYTSETEKNFPFVKGSDFITFKSTV